MLWLPRELPRQRGTSPVAYSAREIANIADLSREEMDPVNKRLRLLNWLLG